MNAWMQQVVHRVFESIDGVTLTEHQKRIWRKDGRYRDNAAVVRIDTKAQTRDIVFDQCRPSGEQHSQDHIVR